MLFQLNVKNFALIDDLKLNFAPGFNVLSGETGAGKSIIIGALGLILGERASAEHVREGSREAYIEAHFSWEEFLPATFQGYLEDYGITPEDTLIISREVLKEGRSIARVNGRGVPVSFLKELGAFLVDLHGQHEHQSLLQPSKHLEMLDEFGGEEVVSQREEVASLYQRIQECRSQLEELGKDNRERERRKEILRHQIEEIEKAEVSVKEEEELLHQERVLSHAEKLFQHLYRAHQQLTGEESSPETPSLRDGLSEVQQEIEEAAAIDSSLQEVAEMISGAAAQLEEAVLELGRYQSGISFDPQELGRVQGRLEEIKDLKKKYGATVEEVLQFAEARKQELEDLEGNEERAEKLEEEIQKFKQQLEEACGDLSEKRREASERLEDALSKALADLALEQARITIQLEPGSTFSPRGWDRAEFMFSANPGESLKPLNKIVSGGEMSRVMLALKSILASKDRIPTLIFDEVDAGIGGQTIQAVAEKIVSLSSDHQVLCVTHSPHLASMADHHLLLYKEEREGRTVTKAFPLSDQERREELARMLDGGLDPVNLQHVDTFLERAAKIKQGRGYGG